VKKKPIEHLQTTPGRAALVGSKRQILLARDVLLKKGRIEAS
jgi:hypothetical protein